MLTSCIREDLLNIIGSDLPWDRFAGKRVLVTGAAGFLPAYFVETLLALGTAGNDPKEVVGLALTHIRGQLWALTHIWCCWVQAAPITRA